MDVYCHILYMFIIYTVIVRFNIGVQYYSSLFHGHTIGVMAAYHCMLQHLTPHTPCHSCSTTTRGHYGMLLLFALIVFGQIKRTLPVGGPTMKLCRNINPSSVTILEQVCICMLIILNCVCD